MYVFDWVENSFNKKIWLIKTIDGTIVASISPNEHYLISKNITKYSAKIYHYPNYNPSIHLNTIPTNSDLFETISEAKRWVNVNLKDLGYRFVSNKYQVLK